MARPTIADDITRLETELANLRVKISNQEAVVMLDEGGGGSRFSTTFTPIEKLYTRAENLEAKLEMLYAYSERRGIRLYGV